MPHYKVTQNIFELAWLLKENNEFHSLKDEVSFSFLVLIMLMKMWLEVNLTDEIAP